MVWKQIEVQYPSCLGVRGLKKAFCIKEISVNFKELGFSNWFQENTDPTKLNE